jgi:hypothetical protein
MRNSNIVITLANQRTGTKFLGNCFNHGSEILHLGEVFSNYSSDYSFDKFLENNNNSKNLFLSGDIFGTLDNYLTFLSTLYPNVHIDIMYSNIYYFSPRWWDEPKKLPIFEYIKTRLISVIHLVRNDRDSYVSLMNAKLTGIYHKINNMDEMAHPPIMLESDQKIINDFEAFKVNSYFYKTNIKNYFLNYPYFVELDYSNLVDNDNFLTMFARKKIAKVIDKNINIDLIQVSPSNMYPTTKTDAYYKLHKLIG